MQPAFTLAVAAICCCSGRERLVQLILLPAGLAKFWYSVAAFAGQFDAFPVQMLCG
jgi:hypothetical protein